MHPRIQVLTVEQLRHERLGSHALWVSCKSNIKYTLCERWSLHAL